MKLKEKKIRISGRVRAIIRDAETGEILETTPWVPNLVTDDGEELVAQWLAGEAPDLVNYCGVGSDNTAANETDSTLGAEIDRLEVTLIERAGSVLTFSTYFGTGDGNGSWEEEGLFNAASDGVLFARALFAATITKNATLTVTVEHEITVGGA